MKGIKKGAAGEPCYNERFVTVSVGPARPCSGAGSAFWPGAWVRSKFSVLSI